MNTTRYIKTSCELPRCMLDKEDILNDYDFVLYHQYLKDDIYKNHYLKKRKDKPGRLMILDNSAYEFFVSKEVFDEEGFLRVIGELQPDFYIVPDVLMDKEKTIENFNHWIPIAKELGKAVKSKPYFVPQGYGIYDMKECMSYMNRVIVKEGFEKRFCIPFHNKFFADGSMRCTFIDKYYFDCNLTIDDRYAAGRMTFMKQILEEYNDYKFHMLGSHNPIEIDFYSKLYPENIETFDSGYPVKLAIEGVLMGEETEKPSLIIDDFFGSELPEETIDLIMTNINIMKSYRKRYREK